MEGAKRPVPNKGARRPVPKRVIHFPFAPPKATYTEVGLRPTNPEHAAIWDDYFDFVGEVTVGRELSPTGDEPEYHSDGTYTMGVPMDSEGKRTIYSSTPSTQKLLEAKRRKIAADHSDSAELLSTTVGNE